jgi:WD40 repeat protein
MRWPPLNPRFVIYAAILIFAAQGFGTESVLDDLVRLQERDGLTFAWQAGSSGDAKPFKGLTDEDTPIRGIYFKNREVIPLRETNPQLRPVGFRFSEMPDPATTDLCWTHDRTTLAATMYAPSGPFLGTYDPRTKKAAAFESPVDREIHFSTQCWSPDDESIAYQVGGSVKIVSLNSNPQAIRTLAKGTKVTWSPDGQWIAFLDNDTYYAIHPDGTGRRKLFHNHWGTAVSALYWSPDSRIVAYVRELGFLQGGALDAEVNQLRARRLADGDETTLCPDSVDGAADYQWVTSPVLIKEPQ